MGKVSEIVSGRIGGAITNVNTWGGLIYAAKAYSLKGDGVTDDYAALNTLISTTIAGDDAAIVFYDGDYVIGTNITIPSNITLWFIQGGTLKPSTGKTVTINGYIESGEYQIFSGSGLIIGRALNSLIYAQWFGLPANDATDGSPSLQKAINYAQLNDTPLMIPRKIRIRLDSQVIIKKGKNAAIDVSMNITIYWNDAIVLPNLNDYAIYVQPLCTNANAGNGWAISNVNWYDVQFDNYYGTLNSYTLSRAFKLGVDGFAFDGFAHSIFKNILMTGFNNGHSFLINHCRFITFENVYTRTGGGVKIQCLTDGEFCGDLVFNDCEFSGNATNRPIYITAYSAVVPSEIRGVRFVNCITYGSGTLIDASTTAKIGDIWVENCAWDVGTVNEDAIAIHANGTSMLFNILFSNLYIASFSGTANGVKLFTDGASVIISNITFNGGEVGIIGRYGFDIVNFSNFNIRDIVFGSIGGITAIGVDIAKNFHIQDNTIESGAALTSMISVGSTACNNYIITGNLGKVAVSDLGSTNKVVANNLVMV